MGIWYIYAGWGMLPLITGIPGNMVYLCWLGLLGLPLTLPDATSEYRNSWESGISILAGATGATSDAI